WPRRARVRSRRSAGGRDRPPPGDGSGVRGPVGLEDGAGDAAAVV
ncbi:MAG: hypothetical protein AVDCRST_MAG35-89, partial [uncultured Quadrisphaera sp.]